MRKRLAVAISAALFLASGLNNADAKSGVRAQLVSITRWQIAQPWFGGFSGIELSADGRKMVAVSDRGFFVTARLERDGDVLNAVNLTSKSRLLGRNGKTPAIKNKDAEGLAQADGPLFVSFEHWHRVDAYHSLNGPAKSTVKFPIEVNPPENGSFEAIAIDHRGRLLAFAEEPLGNPKIARILRLEHGRWSAPYTISRHSKFKPVGADVGPDGKLYILERGFNGIGFRNRIRRFDMNEDKLANETLLLRTGVGLHDNLEGLAVWRDGAGNIRLTMISDDNYRFFQRTEIVEYVVPQTP